VTQFHRELFCSPGACAWVRTGGAIESPINGAFETVPFIFPGVNPWATENSIGPPLEDFSCFSERSGFVEWALTNPLPFVNGNDLTRASDPGASALRLMAMAFNQVLENTRA